MYPARNRRLSVALAAASLASACTLINAPDRRDPCAANAEVCDPLASCESDDGGGFVCQCPRGYRDVRGDGTRCRDRDECRDGSNDCDVLATCHNEPGGYRCECPSDYLDMDRGRHCVLPDPCATGQHDCRPDSELCMPLDEGGYRCVCRKGFTTDDAGRCSDVDECALGQHDCPPSALCENLVGGFRCSCPAGLAPLASGACGAPDPCAGGDRCGDGARCEATGSATYRCICVDGYRERTDSSCVDLDECLDDPCEWPTVCRNLPGSFECACPAYYGLGDDGLECVDRHFVRAEALDTTYPVKPLLDADGNLFLVGAYKQLLEVCGQSRSASSVQLFVAKYDAERNCQWVQEYGDTGDEQLLAATLDPEGNPVLAAAFEGVIDLGGAVADSGGYAARLVAKLDGNDGSGLWKHVFYNIEDLQEELATDPAGNVIWGGTLRFGLKLDDPPRDLDVQQWNVFVGKLDGADGSLLFSHIYLGSNPYVAGIAVDAAGEITVAGRFDWSLTFEVGGDSLWHPTNALFLVRLSELGDLRWYRAIDLQSPSWPPASLTLLPDGDLALGGTFSGSLALIDPPPEATDGDLFFMRLDGENGATRWTRVFAGDGLDRIDGLGADARGEIFAAGSFAGTYIDFGDGPVPQPGAFVIKLAGDGSLGWWQHMGGVLEFNAAQGLSLNAGRLAMTALLDSPGTLGALPLPGMDGLYSTTLVELTP